MSFSIDEITKSIKFSELGVDEKLSKSEREELLEEIGEYVKITMLDMIAQGRSPVTGRKWKGVKEEYADRYKGGQRTADLQLNGDLLDALDYKISKNTLEVGWFDSDQAVKAFGHTTGMEGHPWLDGVAPKRKLIPKDEEKFTAEIRQGIKIVIEDFLDAREG